jgi:PadR family transcriptional regulator AphA
MTERALLPGEYVVLALLVLRPMHGYEMMCFVEEKGLLAVCPLEQSTLYSYLHNVESRGLVEWNEERIGLRPPRKTYALTRAGRSLIDAWLRQPVERMREVRLEFLLKLFFLSESDPAAHRRLLADQVRVCRTYLADLERKDTPNAFTRLVAHSKRSAAEATLNWLEAHAAQLEEELLPSK